MARTALADAVPPIKGTAQVKFKVLDGTEPILSMPMLAVNGNNVVFRGEDATLITAEEETAPLTSIEDGWYLKVLINNSNEFIRHVKYVHQVGFGI